MHETLRLIGTYIAYSALGLAGVMMWLRNKLNQEKDQKYQETPRIE